MKNQILTYFGVAVLAFMLGYLVHKQISKPKEPDSGYISKQQHELELIKMKNEKIRLVKQLDSILAEKVSDDDKRLTEPGKKVRERAKRGSQSLKDSMQKEITEWGRERY